MNMFIRKLYPEIKLLGKQDAEKMVEQARRNAFVRHPGMNTAVYWICFLIGIAIAIAIAIGIHFEFSSLSSLIVLPLSIGVGVGLGTLFSIVSYQVWEAYRVSIELKKNISHKAV